MTVVRRLTEARSRLTRNNNSALPLRHFRLMPLGNRKSNPDSVLKALLQVMDDAVVIKSPDGKITLWNRAAAEMFGYSAPEVIGESADILIPKTELQPWRDCEKRLRGDGKVRRWKTVRLAKGGERIRVKVTVTVTDQRRPTKSEIVELYRCFTPELETVASHSS